MQYDDFIGQVQNRAHLASHEQAVRAIRATLSTLAQRLTGGEPKDVAAQLPEEIGFYMLNQGGPERFDLREFFQRVADIENADYPDAVFHARAVISVLLEAVSPGEIDDLRAQLDEEFDALFTAKAEGKLHWPDNR